ncbi:uncharacterized protein LOC122854568 [Aphidius gifuensis]|uniref:uncharacterized protein LOC122854568 n=1 Tax=Aphidius gifuensis TaxID=684658 RepID=UPI001CDD6020|nr:uncharacterized protein LOC122854568 [Aphidius gifuensis]
MRPCEVVGQNIETLKQTVYDNSNYCHVKPKFNVNDNVRISKYKHIFEKGYKPNWTNEIFTIIKMNKTAPVTYKLKDYQENPIQGCFYNEELQRVKHSDIYLIE